MLVTVKDVELLAVQQAFGVDSNAYVMVEGHQVWPHVVGKTRIAIVCVGFAGNVDSAYVLTRMFSSLRFRAAALVGMAAGVQHEVNLGDAVVADGVLGYDSVTLEKTRIVPSYEYYGISEPLFVELLPLKSDAGGLTRSGRGGCFDTRYRTLTKMRYPDGLRNGPQM